jgi:hypothetical protein
MALTRADHDGRAAQIRRPRISQGFPQGGRHPLTAAASSTSSPRTRRSISPNGGFADVGGTLKGIAHHYASFNWIFSGANVVVSEGTSHGGHKDGSWRAGMPEWGTSGGVSNESGQQCPAFGVGCRSRASGNSKHYSSSRRTRRRSGRSLTSHPSSVSSRPRRSLRSSRASSGRLPQARSYRLPRGAGATRLRCRTIARPHRARNLPRPRRLRAVVHRLHRQGQRDHEMPCSGYFVRAARGNGNAALSYRYLIS